MERDDLPAERHLADALRRLNDAAVVPAPDPAREAALMAAFDVVHGSAPVLSERGESKGRRDHWHLAAFAAAAALLIVAGLAPGVPGRRGDPPARPVAAHPPLAAHDVRIDAPGEFVIVPGAAGLPQMESGTLVRMEVPVAVLPSLGVTPPSGRAATVTADLIVAQDGLARAVRVVRTITAP